MNLTGLKKRDSIDERLAYGNAVLPLIIDSADNPLTVSNHSLIHVESSIYIKSIDGYHIYFLGQKMVDGIRRTLANTGWLYGNS